MTGWLKLWRYLFTKPIWINSSPEQKTVLITIMGMVNYESNQWEWKGKQFDLVPGQVITSIAKIQQRAGRGISQQNVRSSIARFEKLEFLTNQSTNAGRLITIINWEIYQGDDPDVNKVINRWVTSSQQTPNKPPTKQLTPIKEKNKNIKNIKKENLNLFNNFWNLYPKKKSKGQAEKAWKTIKVTNELFDEIIKGLDRAIRSQQWLENIKFIPYPATWLNAKGWEDEDVEVSNVNRPGIQEVEKDTRTPEEQKAGMEKFRKFASGLKLKKID